MRPIKLLAFAVSLGLFASNGFANWKKHEAAMKATPYEVIVFAEGSALLSDSDKADLRALIRDAEAKGEIDEVTIAAWSDKSLPRQGRSLLLSDRNLAERRAEAISDFLKAETSVTDTDTFNMAESANWLARTFNTEDAELKSIFGKAGSVSPVTKMEFKAIRKSGAPSHSVVVVEKFIEPVSPPIIVPAP